MAFQKDKNTLDKLVVVNYNRIMTYVTMKYIKGNPYLYLVRSEREGEKVRQVFVKYLGREGRYSQEELDNIAASYEREYEPREAVITSPEPAPEVVEPIVEPREVVTTPEPAPEVKRPKVSEPEVEERRLVGHEELIDVLKPPEPAPTEVAPAKPSPEFEREFAKEYRQELQQKMHEEIEAKREEALKGLEDILSQQPTVEPSEEKLVAPITREEFAKTYPYRDTTLASELQTIKESGEFGIEQGLITREQLDDKIKEFEKVIDTTYEAVQKEEVPTPITEPEPRTGQQMREIRDRLQGERAGWQVPQSEFINIETEVSGMPLTPEGHDSLIDTHKNLVQKAMREGEDVSPEILKDYPALTPAPSTPPAEEEKPAEVAPTPEEPERVEGTKTTIEPKPNGLRCSNCGRPIKRPYYFEGKPYGIECWKDIALPEIERRREEKFKDTERERYIKSALDIEVLKLKDLSKITSDFKRQFIPSVISQFEEKGFISNKQRDIITDMWNQKDWKNYWRLAVEAGIQDKDNLIQVGHMTEEDFTESPPAPPEEPEESEQA